MKIRSFTISLLVLIVFSMNLTSCGAAPVSPTLTPSPTQTSAPAFTATPSPTPIPVEATPLPPEVQYEASADGTVLWTKEGMANGELRVRDEKAKELRDDTLRALWAVNNALVNPAYKADTPQNIIDDHSAFLAQFPTANALIKYVEDGGAPIDIYIPVNNTKALSGHAQRSCEVQKITNIDLSRVVVGFDIVPKDELLTDAQVWEYDYIGTPYCDFEFMARQYLIEPKTSPDGGIILSWMFRNGANLDGVKTNMYNRAPLFQEQTLEEKLIGISDLARAALKMTARLKPDHADVNKAYDPPVVLLNYKYLDYYTNDSTASNSYFELSK